MVMVSSLTVNRSQIVETDFSHLPVAQSTPLKYWRSKSGFHNIYMHICQHISLSGQHISTKFLCHECLLTADIQLLSWPNYRAPSIQATRSCESYRSGNQVTDSPAKIESSFTTTTSKLPTNSLTNISRHLMKHHLTTTKCAEPLMTWNVEVTETSDRLQLDRSMDIEVSQKIRCRQRLTVLCLQRYPAVTCKLTQRTST